MRDLEIRGAGNLLGPEQSGFLMSVGYDLYLKLLEEAVLEEKGEAPAKRRECTADLSVAASRTDTSPPLSSAWTCTAASPASAHRRMRTT